MGNGGKTDFLNKKEISCKRETLFTKPASKSVIDS